MSSETLFWMIAAVLASVNGFLLVGRKLPMISALIILGLPVYSLQMGLNPFHAIGLLLLGLSVAVFVNLLLRRRRMSRLP